MKKLYTVLLALMGAVFLVASSAVFAAPFNTGPAANDQTTIGTATQKTTSTQAHITTVTAGATYKTLAASRMEKIEVATGIGTAALKGYAADTATTQANFPRMKTSTHAYALNAENEAAIQFKANSGANADLPGFAITAATGTSDVNMALFAGTDNEQKIHAAIGRTDESTGAEYEHTLATFSRGAPTINGFAATTPTANLTATTTLAAMSYTVDVGLTTAVMRV